MSNIPFVKRYCKQKMTDFTFLKKFEKQISHNSSHKEKEL